MQENTRKSLPDDPFASLYSIKRGCYSFRLKEDIPAFGLKYNQLLHARAQAPQAGDLLVCPTKTHTSTIFIGKLIRQKGNRVLVELSSGLQLLVLIDTVLVVVEI